MLPESFGGRIIYLLQQYGPSFLKGAGGEPAVKYRGIFINDEWPCMGNWTTRKFGGFNSKMYVHIYELLLRLKANFLWPAMWSSFVGLQ